MFYLDVYLNSLKAFKKGASACLILLLTLLLGACQLNYPSQHQPSLEIEQAWIDTDIDIIFNQTGQIQFTSYTEDSLFNFTQGKNLLLKINIKLALDEKAITEEHTLSLYPKYLNQVSYFQINDQNESSRIQTQFRNYTNNDRYFSSQRYAFNVNDSDLLATHYLLIESDNKRYVRIEMSDSKSYIHADAQISQFFTIIYSFIFAMALFNAVFFYYTREKAYLLYTLYMVTSVYSLLWQEGKINELPAIAWHVLGVNSSLVYIAMANFTGIAFLYNFMQLKLRQSWLVKLLLVLVACQLGLVFTALFQYHLLAQPNAETIKSLFNLSILCSSLLILLIIIIKFFQKQPQARYLLIAWGLMIASVVLRIYFSLHPHPDLIWMAHSYEIAIMLEGVILAFAIGNRTIEFRKQRDQAINKYSKAERSIQKHQLISQFQHEMQKLIKDDTLNSEQVAEKTNIKFHLLLNRAFPIQNSMILTNGEITGICTTGLDTLDVDLLKLKANSLINCADQKHVIQKTLTYADNKIQSFLFIPLNENRHPNVTFILRLKNQAELKFNYLLEVQSFCEEAYTELTQGKAMYQVALAANMDSMTQCHNRSSIESFITQSLEQRKITTIAYVDLDNLKTINDQYGHPIGDQCIIDFSQLLESAMNKTARVGRIGGDEFLVVFISIDFDECISRIESFMSLLEQAVISDEKLNITSSVGIAESRMNETTKSLIKKADKALYQSKQQGRNRITSYNGSLEDMEQS